MSTLAQSAKLLITDGHCSCQEYCLQDKMERLGKKKKNLQENTEGSPGLRELDFILHSTIVACQIM